MSLVKFIADPKFEDYKEAFKDNYILERRDDGVILVQAHTVGGPIQLSVENHRSVAQIFKTVGADPENEIMIFTGSGEDFMMEPDPDGFKIEADNLSFNSASTVTIGVANQNANILIGENHSG